MLTYWSIPDHYTIGDTFESLGGALSTALAKLIAIRIENEQRGSFIPTRVEIDERVTDHLGDRPVRRFTLTSEEL